MSKYTLYFSPGACSRVTMNALFETGQLFSPVLIDIKREENKTPKYLDINPKGKVPALLTVDGIITENVAILDYLDHTHPEAHLLPPSTSSFARSQYISDLAWASSTLHIWVRQVLRPDAFTASPSETNGIRMSSVLALHNLATDISTRLTQQPWWYGENWSIMDMYLYWVYSTAGRGGFPILDYPKIIEHAQRIQARPAFQKAQNLEALEADKANYNPTFRQSDLIFSSHP